MYSIELDNFFYTVEGTSGVMFSLNNWSLADSSDTVNVYIGMKSDKTIAIIGREAYNSLTSKPDSAYPRILTIPIDG